MDLSLFASTFALVFLAELPGKTTFASLLMASRGKPLHVLFGAGGAFVIHSVIAVAAGRLIGLLPLRAVETLVGLLFLGLAVSMWRQKPGGEERPPVGVRSAFMVVFLAQWGDPSQLATAALAAKSGAPWTVFLAATLALWAVTGLAVAVGHLAKKAVQPAVLQKAVSLVFACVGSGLLIEAFRGR